MDVKDLIYDFLYKVINEDDNIFSEEVIEEMSIAICEMLNICEKCGAKLKGERNE